ncbi:protein S40-7-like [Gastrolobium bilobum]|uniref:protein S40-7-like n=1 Tax=Gastrolobium bilobum TaxID=150636 RepID=UPI002AB14F1C|nr:protein S40-7-like [Gastrolobium bilobum]
MDSFHRRSSSSSDRLLGVFTFSPSPAAAADELNEAELFWATDFPGSENQIPLPQPAEKNSPRSFDRRQDSGILVALTKPDRRAGDVPVFRGKSSVSSSMMIPSLPRLPPGPGSESVSSRKFQQSAPVKVPILLSKDFARRRNGDELGLVDDDDDDDEMLPPHEIVARGFGVSPKTTSSVLEGVGRTLKGRDLRHVRNAVLRKTGFLD